jgi:hypothetical protein
MLNNFLVQWICKSVLTLVRLHLQPVAEGRVISKSYHVTSACIIVASTLLSTDAVSISHGTVVNVGLLGTCIVPTQLYIVLSPCALFNQLTRGRGSTLSGLQVSLWDTSYGASSGVICNSSHCAQSSVIVFCESQINLLCSELIINVLTCNINI